MGAFLILLILNGTVQLAAQKSTALKTWSFQGKMGEVQIRASQVDGSGGAKTCVLQIFSPGGANRSAAEEAEFLSTVLNDLPNLSVNVQAINGISFRFNEPEPVATVAAYAASSRKWRKALATKNISVVYPLVTSFLNESGAYTDWDRVFKAHGLALRVAGVEEVIMEPFSKAHASCPAGADCKSLLVPKDALVQMNVIPIAHR
jgi:hypothetical protein